MQVVVEYAVFVLSQNKKTALFLQWCLIGKHNISPLYTHWAVQIWQCFLKWTPMLTVIGISLRKDRNAETNFLLEEKPYNHQKSSMNAD